MNRRQFLRRAATGLLVAAAPTIFLPPRGGWFRSLAPQWGRPTAAEILADINRTLTEVWSASSVVRPDRIIITAPIFESLKSEGLIVPESGGWILS